MDARLPRLAGVRVADLGNETMTNTDEKAAAFLARLIRLEEEKKPNVLALAA